MQPLPVDSIVVVIDNWRQNPRQRAGSFPQIFFRLALLRASRSVARRRAGTEPLLWLGRGAGGGGGGASVSSGLVVLVEVLRHAGRGDGWKFVVLRYDGGGDVMDMVGAGVDREETRGVGHRQPGPATEGHHQTPTDPNVLVQRVTPAPLASSRQRQMWSSGCCIVLADATTANNRRCDGGGRLLDKDGRWRGGAGPRRTCASDAGGGRDPCAAAAAATCSPSSGFEPFGDHEGITLVSLLALLQLHGSLVAQPQVADVAFARRIWRQVVQAPTATDFRSEGALDGGVVSSGRAGQGNALADGHPGFGAAHWRRQVSGGRRRGCR